MTSYDHQSILAAARELSDLGFSLHWLHRKQKRPKGDDWQNRPFQNFGLLSSGYAMGDNLGVRLGEPSRLGDLYLHVIDADIRVASLADEADAALRELLPVNPDTLPLVRSGSGGASFHLYFVTDKPFRSKKLAQSDGKHRTDAGTWSRDWEIELFGTGKQVVLPPSIHPSGKPYVWERPFDDFEFQFNDAYRIESDDLARLAVPDDATYEYESVSPLDFKAGVMERLLDDIEVSDLDYDDWLRLGQALHHQLGGTEEGFQLWLKHTERSTKHDGKNSTVRTMRMKWRSFGKYRGRPVTMATISQWAQEARLAALTEDLDDLDDLEDVDDGLRPSDSGESEDDFDGLFDSDNNDNRRAADSSDDGTSEDDPFKPDLTIKWQSLLDVNEEGGIKGTLHNITLIVENDPRTKDIIRWNAFADKLVQFGNPGTLKRRKKAAKPTIQLDGDIWRVRDPMNGDPWQDTKDALLRRMIEAPKTQGGYGIKVSDRDLVGAIEIAAARNAFHPVQEYLRGLSWDGQPRMERLFIDYLRTPDNAYYRNVARLTLVAAVTRVFEPGHKFDFCPILEGLQGRRKSTFINVLGRDWSAELDGDFADDRAMIEKMQGAWILEIPELSGFNKAEVNHIKAFMSRREDRARMAYARRPSIFLRQCIFMGSTNDDRYLKDETGGRRFWPVACTLSMDEEIDTDALARNVDQLWAEAYQAYVAMRAEQPYGTLPLYLRDKDAAKYALMMQESRRTETTGDVLAGRIEAWLNRQVYSGDISDGAPTLRDITCCAQIWKECLGGDEKHYDTKQQYAIAAAMRKIKGWEQGGKHRFDSYGQQRAYYRVTSDV